MRVAVVIDSLGLGGAERLLITYARHAPAVGVDLRVLALRDLGATLVTDQLAELDVDVRYVPTRCRHHLVDPRRLARLARELRRAEPDVVQTHLGTANMLGVAAARLASLPVIATLHSLWLDEGTARARAAQAALRRADAIVAVGDEVARTHARPVAPRPITVVSNPVEVPSHDLSPSVVDARRHELTGGTDGPILLAVGRLVPVKGHLVLLDALRGVVDRHPGVVLAVAGDGPLAEDLRRRARELGLEGNVRLLGARRDVPELLAAADLFVSSSHHEGLPLAVLEAMAAGSAVVATDVGDLGSVLAGAGVVVPPGDPTSLAHAIDELLADGPRRRALAAAGRAVVRDRYDPTVWMTRLRSVYDRVGGPVAVAP